MHQISEGIGDQNSEKDIDSLGSVSEPKFNSLSIERFSSPKKQVELVQKTTHF